MPSPFPGMDPYLEGYLWPDVHHRLATQISDQLMPLLRPRYVARIEVQVVSDETPEAEIGIMYPDVEIVRSPRQPEVPLPSTRAGQLTTPTITPVSVSVPLLEVEVPLASVEIRDTAQNQLVTCIEILSPINKREPGLNKDREKRRRLHEADVHLLEIDLLRRGQRPLAHLRIPSTPYLVSLTRAGSKFADIWAINLQDPLPVVSIPLRVPDPDVALDLSLAFTTIYERAAYDLSLNYNEPPPPPSLTATEQVWLKQLLEDLNS
jgi:hypothetical protein